jgi:hypothetical protein
MHTRTNGLDDRHRHPAARGPPKLNVEACQVLLISIGLPLEIITELSDPQVPDDVPFDFELTRLDLSWEK